jgi:hypothetical protein
MMHLLVRGAEFVSLLGSSLIVLGMIVMLVISGEKR